MTAGRRHYRGCRAAAWHYGRIVSSPGRFYARRNSWYARLLVRTPAGFLLVAGGVAVGAWLVATRVELTRYVAVPVERRDSVLVGYARPSLLRAAGAGREVVWRAGAGAVARGTLVSWEESGDGDRVRFLVSTEVEGGEAAGAAPRSSADDRVTVDLPAGTETLFDRMKGRALGRRPPAIRAP